jgi:hypothetical protein
MKINFNIHPTEMNVIISLVGITQSLALFYEILVSGNMYEAITAE